MAIEAGSIYTGDTMRARMEARWGVAIAVAALLMLLAAPGAQASDHASLRFFHAVPGVGGAELSADGERMGSARFAEATGYQDAPAGEVRLELAAGGGEPVTEPASLEAGKHYTVVAMARDGGAELRVFSDGAARDGLARLRMIHAAPELGEPDLEVGNRVVARRAGYTESTPYESLRPGSYDIAANDPNGEEPIVSKERVALTAGTTSTAIIVGSRGERARIVMVDDDSVGPASGPHTGLGGLAPDTGPRWLLALAAALLAGALGGGCYRLLSAAPRSGRSRGG